MLAAPSRPVDPTLVSPAWPQPGPMRTTGAGSPSPAPSRGNQCARMRVPSNEVTSRSLGVPATSATSGAGSAGRSHAGRPPPPAPAASSAAPSGGESSSEPEQADAVSSAPAHTTANTRAAVALRANRMVAPPTSPPELIQVSLNL